MANASYGNRKRQETRRRGNMNIKSQYSLNMRPRPMVSPSKKSQSADGWMAFYPFNISPAAGPKRDAPHCPNLKMQSDARGGMKGRTLTTKPETSSRVQGGQKQQQQRGAVRYDDACGMLGES